MIFVGFGEFGGTSGGLIERTFREKIIVVGLQRPPVSDEDIAAQILVLFNAGHEQITTTVVALPGWAAKLTSTVPTAIAPRSWGVVSFLAPPDCGTYPSDVRVVQIRVRTAAGLTDQIVPLPEPAEALQDYHLAVCGPGWQPG